MPRGLAAAALVAVTAGVTYRVTMARMGGPGPATQVAAAPAAPTATPNVTAPGSAPESSNPPAPVAPASTTGTGASAQPVARVRVSAAITYDREIARLHDVLEQRTTDLDPATIAILQNSLATINKAITEARAALLRDPASRFLNNQLNRALEQKLGLLRTAALLPART
jgi:hypothetical protein